MFYREKYLHVLEGFAFTPVIKVLTGIRRVGKSSLLQTYIQRQQEKKNIPAAHILTINKELFIFDHLKTANDLFAYFQEWYATLPENVPFMVAIDEVQEIFEWEKVINSLLASYQKRIDITITGSNASLLSSDLATLLSGRYITLRVFPFSFTEYCEYHKKNPDKSFFLEYLRFGGLPGTFFLPREDSFLDAYLQGIYSTVLLKDVVEYFSVRNVEFLKQLYQFVFTNIGNIVSAKKISDYLKSQKISHSMETVLQYLHYGEDAFLLQKVVSCDPGSKRVFEIYQKYYVGDIGLRNAICGYSPVRDQGRILENYVFLQLLGAGYSVKIGRLKDATEIDFIAEKNGITKYFQVCYLLADETVIEREYAPFEKIYDQWEKYVISLDEENMGMRNGIRHENIWKLEEIL